MGVYSSLELANGETIVSTGVAPHILVYIGKVQCRLSLITVSMMEGFSVILGKDWLDALNPLVDWRSNTVYLRVGNELHKVQDHSTGSLKSYGIKDQGLNGL